MNNASKVLKRVRYAMMHGIGIFFQIRLERIFTLVLFTSGVMQLKDLPFFGLILNIMVGVFPL